MERSVPQKAPRFFSLRGAFCSAYFFESVTRSFFLYVDVRVNCLEGYYVAWNVPPSHSSESRPWWISSIDYDVIWRHKRLFFTIRLSIHDSVWLTFASRTLSFYQKTGDFRLPRHNTSCDFIDDVKMKFWCSVQCLLLGREGGTQNFTRSKKLRVMRNIPLFGLAFTVHWRLRSPCLESVDSLLLRAQRSRGPHPLNSNSTFAPPILATREST